MRPFAAAAVLLAVLPAVAGAEPNVLSIAVTDLAARGVDDVAAAALTTEVTNVIAGMGVFSVISGEDIKRLISLEGTRQACTGAVDAGCLAEIGGALGVDYLVYGEVARVGQTYSLSLSLLDTKKASAAGRSNRKVDQPGQLLEAVGGLVKILLRPLLEANRGFLVLDVREAGAKVAVDGRLVGVTPLQGRIELTMGPHDVALEKSGFVQWVRTVEISPANVTVESVVLVPNQAYIDAYHEDAARVRLWAWVTAGAGLGLVATAAVVRLTSDARFDDLVAKRYLETRAMCSPLDPGHDGSDYCPTDLGRMNGVVDEVDSIETADSAALAAGIAGAASALVSIVLFAVGDEPGKYSAYSAGPGPSAGALRPYVGPSGSTLGVFGRF